MNVLVRLWRALPEVAFLLVLGAVVFGIVAVTSTVDRAKEVVLRLFHLLNAALTAFFLLGVAYALVDGNQFVAELSAGFAVVSVAALLITMWCRHVYLRNRPGRRARSHVGEPPARGIRQRLVRWWRDFL